MNVRVIVGSKYGATREIGEAIAEELSAAGHDATALDAEEVEGLGDPDAVVLGSAVYAGHWLKPAMKLLEDRADELARRPTWLFSSGPVGDPLKPEDAEPVGIAEAVEATGARGHEVFAGKIDRGVLSRPERLMVRALCVPEGDYRDWDAIRGWARGIAAELDAG
jgi:menaquinone-dependent protoporphyrinogen oxidase